MVFRSTHILCKWIVFSMCPKRLNFICSIYFLLFSCNKYNADVIFRFLLPMPYHIENTFVWTVGYLQTMKESYIVLPFQLLRCKMQYYSEHGLLVSTHSFFEKIEMSSNEIPLIPHIHCESLNDISMCISISCFKDIKFIIRFKWLRYNILDPSNSKIKYNINIDNIRKF